MRYTLAAILLCCLQSINYAQTTKVTLSAIVKDGSNDAPFPYVNTGLFSASDSSFVSGTITDEEGRFSLSDINPGNYLLKLTYLGYEEKYIPVLIGSLSTFLDMGSIRLKADNKALDEVTITSRQGIVSGGIEKKTFALSDNLSQLGSSALEAMKNLPGVTVQDGKVQLRGSDKITVLIDGKQTALTGFGNQSGLDNIPASAIEKIEIINNPSAKFDANGNAGIINIIYKKGKERRL